MMGGRPRQDWEEAVREERADKPLEGGADKPLEG